MAKRSAHPLHSVVTTAADSLRCDSLVTQVSSSLHDLDQQLKNDPLELEKEQEDEVSTTPPVSLNSAKYLRAAHAILFDHRFRLSFLLCSDHITFPCTDQEVPD